MSTFHNEKLQCAVCGKKSMYPVLTSTNTFGGSPDLDLRPPEMKRSTMRMWVQECPKCGYVAAEISDQTNITRDFLKASEYRHCDGIQFQSPLAARFYKFYKISREEDDHAAAFFAIHCAAWACDDIEDTENANRCRSLAIALIPELSTEDNRGDLSLVKADLLRRAGRFEELISQYESISFDDELLNSILALQLEKAKAGDSGCYRISDVSHEGD